MKKLFIVPIFLCSSVFALPLGNPIEPSLFYSVGCCGDDCGGGPYYDDPCLPLVSWGDKWNVRIGFYGDYVFNRNLEISGSGLDQGNDIRETELITNAAYLAFNLCNIVDVFGTLGATKISVETSEISWVANGDANGRFETETHFSWSVGARAAIFQWDCFGVGIEGQYFRTTPDLTKYWTWSNGKYNYFNNHNRMTYHEWQFGLGISYTFSTYCPDFKFVPYTGVKWSWARLHTGNFQFVSNGEGNETFTFFNLKTDKCWGYVVGLSFTMQSLIGVTVEGRFGDELALYVNGQFVF